MSLNETKEQALLTWINSLNLDDPVNKLSSLQDGSLLVKLIYRLNGKENEAQTTLDQPIQGRLDFISNFLQSNCKYDQDRGAIVSWENIVNGQNLEVELSKVVVLLLYYSNMCGTYQVFEKLNYKTQAELASVLRFVLDNEESLYLNNNLESFLKRKALFPLSSVSSHSSVSSYSSVSEEESPIIKRKRKPEVQFLDLQTVATSSVSSPIQDVLKTPQFQMRKLRKQLYQERNMRDELEVELANSCKIITERETQLSLLQQKVHKLMRHNNEQDQGPNELEELGNKYESVVKRLQDVRKQCQDLKTNKGQMERKIDQLTEENGNLSFQMRDFLVRLTEAQAAVDKLSDEQEQSVKEWEAKRTQLESALNQAIADKECFSEQILILQGKICQLEDELKKEQSQSRVEGEVMGDVLEMEGLKQEVDDLTVKVSQLEVIIASLEQEKAQALMDLNSERANFESEKSHLTVVIAGLQQALSELGCEKEELQRTSREQQERLTAQVLALNADIDKLAEIVKRSELEVAGLSQKVEEEQRQNGQLVQQMEKKEQSALETIHGLKKQVDDLGSALKVKEEEAVSSTQLWDMERQESGRREIALLEASKTAARERDAALTEYRHFQKDKEQKIGELGQQIHTLEDQWKAEQSLVSKLRNEKGELEQKVAALELAINELRLKCQSLESKSEAQRCSNLEAIETLTVRLQDAEKELQHYEGKLVHHSGVIEENGNLRNQLATLDDTVGNLRVQIEAERRGFEETRSLELQRVCQLGEEVKALQDRTQQMSTDLEFAHQELKKEQQEKLTAQSSLEKLREESGEMIKALSAEHDQASLAIKAKEAEIRKLSSELGSLADKLALTEETKGQELAAKKEEITRLIQEMEGTLEKLEMVNKEKEDMESRLQSRIVEHQGQLSALREELVDVQGTVRQKESELEVILNLQRETSQLEEFQKRLAKEEKETQFYKFKMEDQEKETLHLKTLLNAKEEEIKSLLQSTQAGEERASVIHALQEKREEEMRSLLSRVSELEQAYSEQSRSVAALEQELAEARRLMSEKGTAFEKQANQLLDLQRELSLQQDTTVSLEKRLESSQSKCSEQQMQVEKLSTELKETRSSSGLREAALKQQVDRLLQELARQNSDLETLKQEVSNRKEEQLERDALKKRAAAAAEELEKLQAESLIAASVASEKDIVLQNLQKEIQAVNEKYEELQERDVDRSKLADTWELNLQQHNETVQRLHEEVSAASSLASERQQTTETLEKELSSLQQEVEMLRHGNLVTSALVSEKDSQLSCLQEEIKKLKEQENARNLEAAMERAQQKELQSTIDRLQAEVLAASRAVAVKESQRKELEESISVLKKEVVSASSEREQAAGIFQTQLASLQQENKLMATEKESLQQELVLLRKTEAELCDLQQELTNAQALIGELMPTKRKCQQQQAELCLAQAKHQEELEQRDRTAATLDNELQQAKDEISVLRPLKDLIAEQELSLQKLQKENMTYREQVCKLQQANSQLTSENLEMCSDAEVAMREVVHTQELEKIKGEHQRQIASLKEKVRETCEKYRSIEEEDTKQKVLDDRQKFQEERKKLIVQVEEMQKCLNTETLQVEELTKKLGQQVIATKSERDNVKVWEAEVKELKEKLTRRDEVLEHYKAQVEKAKIHYSGKKQQLQESIEKVQALETALEGSRGERDALKAERKRMEMELHQAQLSAKNLSTKVSSLEAQVDFADRQLREHKKLQGSIDTLKTQKSVCPSVPDKSQDTSKDSLELSPDEDDTLVSKRKRREDKTPAARSSERLAAQRRALSRESLDTLYFTPMALRSQTRLESSITSLGDLTLDSAKKTQSARRRTTQKTPGAPEPENESFFSLHAAQSHPNLCSQRGRPLSMASLSSRYSVSQELFNESSTSEQLLNLPGYRPGTANTSTAHRNTNTFVVGSQNEPEHTDDWMRLAELQARNKTCLPHLKSSYPLEGRPSIGIASLCITDDEVRMGNPDDTIRRASMLPSQLHDTLAPHRMSMQPGLTREGMPSHRATMLPSQIRETVSSHRASLLPKPSAQQSWQTTSGTSKQVKRTTDEPQNGADTPESKKALTSCFPRPMTPKDKNDRRWTMQSSQNKPPVCQDERRQSMAFSITNTPKKAGSLLQRGFNKMRGSTRKSPTSTGKTPRKSPRRSPRIGSGKSPKNTASAKKSMIRKPLKNMKV
ncbi:nuclear mitotic apparatus protein 1 isoform X2 [Amia ocellicauda]|uniref:nuclear mitotic apparatus protein 1 isoform X2 n=1 Tax=Amia ocellicauda TaxID=2972642 RepID=UPI003463D8F1